MTTQRAAAAFATRLRGVEVPHEDSEGRYHSLTAAPSLSRVSIEELRWGHWRDNRWGFTVDDDRTTPPKSPRHHSPLEHLILRTLYEDEWVDELLKSLREALEQRDGADDDEVNDSAVAEWRLEWTNVLIDGALRRQFAAAARRAIAALTVHVRELVGNDREGSEPTFATLVDTLPADCAWVLPRDADDLADGDAATTQEDRHPRRPFVQIAALCFLACAKEHPDAWIAGWGAAACSCRNAKELIVDVGNRAVELIGNAWAGDDDAMLTIQSFAEHLGISALGASDLESSVRQVVGEFEELRWFVEMQLDTIRTEARRSMHPALTLGPAFGMTVLDLVAGSGGRVDCHQLSAFRGLVTAQFDDDGHAQILAPSSSCHDNGDACRALTSVLTAMRPGFEATLAKLANESIMGLNVDDLLYTRLAGHRVQFIIHTVDSSSQVPPTCPITGPYRTVATALWSLPVTQEDAASHAKVIVFETLKADTLEEEELVPWMDMPGGTRCYLRPSRCFIFPHCVEYRVEPALMDKSQVLIVRLLEPTGEFVSEHDITVDANSEFEAMEHEADEGIVAVGPYRSESFEELRCDHYDGHLHPLGRPVDEPAPYYPTQVIRRLNNVQSVGIKAIDRCPWIEEEMYKILWSQMQSTAWLNMARGQAPTHEYKNWLPILQNYCNNQLARAMESCIGKISQSTRDLLAPDDVDDRELANAWWVVLSASWPLHACTQGTTSNPPVSLAYSPTSLPADRTAGISMSFIKDHEHLSIEELRCLSRGILTEAYAFSCRHNPFEAMCWLYIHGNTGMREARWEIPGSASKAVKCLSSTFEATGLPRVTEVIMRMIHVHDIDSSLVAVVTEDFAIANPTPSWMSFLESTLVQLHRDLAVKRITISTCIEQARAATTAHPLNVDGTITLGPAREMFVGHNIIPDSVRLAFLDRVKPLRHQSHYPATRMILDPRPPCPPSGNIRTIATFSIPRSMTLATHFDHIVNRRCSERVAVAPVLPSDVRIGMDGRAEILSYVNNLNPQHFARLYESLEEIISALVPLFEAVATSLTGARPPYPFSLHSQSYECPRPYHLRGRIVQMAFAIEEISLPGMQTKHAPATESTSRFPSLAPPVIGMFIAENDNFSLPRMELNATSGDGTQDSGRIHLHEGRCFAYPSYYADTRPPLVCSNWKKPSRLTIVTVYLLDPERPVLSTISVPPQHKRWVLDATVPIVGNAFRLPIDVQEVIKQML